MADNFWSGFSRSLPLGAQMGAQGYRQRQQELMEMQRFKLAEEAQKIQQQQADRQALLSKGEVLEKADTLPDELADIYYKDIFETFKIPEDEQKALLKMRAKNKEEFAADFRALVGDATDSQVRAFWQLPKPQRAKIMADLFAQKQYEAQSQLFYGGSQPQQAPQQNLVNAAGAVMPPTLDDQIAQKRQLYATYVDRQKLLPPGSKMASDAEKVVDNLRAEIGQLEVAKRAEISAERAGQREERMGEQFQQAQSAAERRFQQSQAAAEKRSQEAESRLEKRLQLTREQQQRVTPAQVKTIVADKSSIKNIDDYESTYNDFVKESGGTASTLLKASLAKNQGIKTIAEATGITGSTPAERKLAASYNALIGNLKSLTSEVGVLTDVDALRILGSFDPTRMPEQVRANLQARRKSHQRSLDVTFDALEATGKDVSKLRGGTAPSETGGWSIRPK